VFRNFRQCRSHVTAMAQPLPLPLPGRLVDRSELGSVISRVPRPCMYARNTLVPTSRSSIGPSRPLRGCGWSCGYCMVRGGCTSDTL
jgi:hypothetical protein